MCPRLTMMSFRKCLFALVLVWPALTVAAEETIAYQFERNALLAGRTLACGDKAGFAAMRSVSRNLATRLEGGVTGQMSRFEERAEQQRRFASGKNPSSSTCRRIGQELRDNLDRSTWILRTSGFED